LVASELGESAITGVDTTFSGEPSDWVYLIKSVSGGCHQRPWSRPPTPTVPIREAIRDGSLGRGIGGDAGGGVPRGFGAAGLHIWSLARRRPV
jgi:hypothetical protein